jgi:hypothetical protein
MECRSHWCDGVKSLIFGAVSGEASEMVSIRRAELEALKAELRRLRPGGDDDVLVQGRSPDGRRWRGKRGVIIGVLVGLVVVLGAGDAYLAINRSPHKDPLASGVVGQWRVTKDETLSNGLWQPASAANGDDVLQGFISFAADGIVTVYSGEPPAYGAYTVQGDNLTIYFGSSPDLASATCTADALVTVDSGGIRRATLTRLG